jgi:GNAT superfamily N-acetyltransferase
LITSTTRPLPQSMSTTTRSWASLDTCATQVERMSPSAIEVADAFQRIGIGTALTSLTIDHAHANGRRFLPATTRWENRAARGLMRNHGFRARRSRGGEIEHKLKLKESSPREAVRVPEKPRLVARAAASPLRHRRGARRTPD